MPSRSSLPLLAALGAGLSLLPIAGRSQAPEPARYHNAEQMERLLEGLADRNKNLVRLRRYGKSWEKRDLLALEITDPGGGKAEEKPGVALIAGVQGDQAGTSEVALRLAQSLLQRASSDPALKELLRTRTLYLVPRVHPDGIERLLGKVPAAQRATLQPLDDDADEATDEDAPQDVDGDGLVLQMRLRDPEGDWRTDPADPRLLVRRKPGESGEWRLFTEGKDADGDGLVAEDGPGGTNPDRNFPALWDWRTKQPGAGPFMVSEPEVRALIEYLQARPNIALVEALQVGASQPFVPGTRNGAQVAGTDRAWIDSLGKKWETATGGKQAAPAAEPGDPGLGTFADWSYLHFGALTVVPSLWATAPGAQMSASGEKPWLEWSDKELQGSGFVAWKPFRHPQLGDVEIGGWKPLTRDNPPPDRVGAIAGKELDFFLQLAGSSPRVTIKDVKVTPRGANVYQVLMTVTNVGGTPTASAQGVLNRTTRPVLGILEAPAGVQLLSGIRRARLGQLAPDESRAVEWTVLAPAGTRLQITSNAQRAGVETREVTLQ